MQHYSNLKIAYPVINIKSSNEMMTNSSSNSLISFEISYEKLVGIICGSLAVYLSSKVIKLLLYSHKNIYLSDDIHTTRYNTLE